MATDPQNEKGRAKHGGERARPIRAALQRLEFALLVLLLSVGALQGIYSLASTAWHWLAGGGSR